MAICDSVTVSMAEAMMGIFKAMVRVMRERMSASDGSVSESPGFSRTSSKVSASRGGSLDFAAMANSAPAPSRRPMRGLDGRDNAISGRKGFFRPGRRPAFGLAEVVSMAPRRFLVRSASELGFLHVFQQELP